MSIHLATDRDFPYILDLSKRHAEELGFIPRAAMLSYLERGRMTVTRENGDDAGYFLTSRIDQRQVRIFQACVQLDARGLNHGLALLSDLITRAALNGTHFLSLHCRDGLESNGFWSACGFKSGGIFPGGKARGKIIHQWELRIADALACPALPYGRHFIASLQPGTTQSALENPLQALARTPQSSEATRFFGQILDTEESNVRLAHRHPPTRSAVLGELLRTLDLAATHGS